MVISTSRVYKLINRWGTVLRIAVADGEIQAICTAQHARGP